MQLGSSNISKSAADTIREMIVCGSLDEGDRINEVHLAEKLGISRTPLREGLSQLVAESIVIIQARKGFFVAPLTLDEFEQLYDVRPLLDPVALKLAGIPSSGRLDILEKINRKMLSAKTPSSAIDIDNAWHAELLASCPNQVLIGLINQIIVRTRRYEHALFRETRHVWVASDEHEKIMSALREHDLIAACALLKQNMKSGKAPIVEWLTHRT